MQAVGFSPAPPRPAAPAGGSGEHEARNGWASPPAAWPALLAVLLRHPPRPGRPGARAFGAVDNPEIVNRGLHVACEPPFSPAALPLSGFRQGCPSAHRLSRFRDRKCGLDLAGREICPAGLTFRPGRGTLYWRGPFRSFGGRPFRGVRGRQKPLGLSTRRLFLCFAHFRDPLSPPPPFVHLILSRQSAPNATKPLSFCCVRWLSNSRCCAANAYGPAGPQNNGFISFGAVLPPPFRQDYTIGGRLCQAFRLPGLPRRLRPLAVSCLSASAYISVTSSPPWFRARRTFSISPYFFRRSTA